MNRIQYNFSKNTIPLFILIASTIIFVTFFRLDKREVKEIDKLKSQIRTTSLGIESSSSKLTSLSQKLKEISCDVDRVKRVFVKVPTKKLGFSYNLNNLLLKYNIKIKTISISSSGKFLNVSLKAEGNERNVMSMLDQLTKRFPIELKAVNMVLPKSNLDVDMEFKEVVRKP